MDIGEWRGSGEKAMDLSSFGNHGVLYGPAWSNDKPLLIPESLFSSVNSLTNLESIPISANFTSNMTGFEESDIITFNASVNNFSGNASNYYFDLIPSGESSAYVQNVALDINDVGNLKSDTLEFISCYAA